MVKIENKIAMKMKHFFYWGFGSLTALFSFTSCSLSEKGMATYEVDEAYWQPGEAFGKPKELSAGALNTQPSAAQAAPQDEDYYDPNVLRQSENNDYISGGGASPMWDPIMGWRMSYPWGGGIGLNNALSLGFSLSPWGSYSNYAYSPFAYNGYSGFYGNSMYGSSMYNPYYAGGSFYGYPYGTPYGSPYYFYNNPFYGYPNVNTNNGNIVGVDQSQNTHFNRPNGSGSASNSSESPVVNRKPKSLDIPNQGHRDAVVIPRNAVKSEKQKSSGNFWKAVGEVMESAAKAAGDGANPGSNSNRDALGRGSGQVNSFNAPSSVPSRGSGISNGTTHSVSPSRGSVSGGRRP